ncbi:hypothetical protein BD311DRAFT_848705 [Dichomitus squalens]|uniref:Uncharacterized protein n=1 Tax=Dichomitus squalens TaxID=114155 RepID=A0A4Q9N0U2_9APHY|nr:hypothetical protein BD311DRAFT_848705 [Dichomitus squalens]
MGLITMIPLDVAMTVLHIFALFDAIDTLRIVDATLPSFSVFWGREGMDYMRNLAQVVSRLNMKRLVIHSEYPWVFGRSCCFLLKGARLGPVLRKAEPVGGHPGVSTDL